MTNLHGFRDDLLLEQEHRKGIAPKETIAASASNSSKGQNLGHVFLVLFQASRSAVKKALTNLEAESMCYQKLWSNLLNKYKSRILLQLFTLFIFCTSLTPDVLSNSLRGFVTHVQIEGRPPLKDDTDAIVRMQEVYRPLLDKVNDLYLRRYYLYLRLTRRTHQRLLDMQHRS